MKNVYEENSKNNQRIWFTILIWVALASLPFWLLKQDFLQGIAIRVFILAGLAYALNIVGGMGGQLSLGNAAFFGLGAYTSALLFINYEISPWAGMIVGGIVAAVFAVLIGYPCFRLRGIYFSLATFVFSLIMEAIFRHFGNITGGDVGLSIPLKGNAPLYFQFANSLPYYFIGLGLLLITFLINLAVTRSKFGYLLLAIRYDQDAAATLGVDATKVKLLAFVLNGVLSAMVGTFYVQYMLFIDPASAFGMMVSVQIILVMIAGGMGSLWGPLLGAAFLIPLGELTNEFLGGSGAGIDKIIFATILIAFVILLPKGLISIPVVINHLRAVSGSAGGGGCK